MLPVARWPAAAAVAVLAAFGAVQAAAQDWRVVDRPTPTPAITYDAARQRLQVLDQRAELCEIDDKGWLRRPVGNGLPLTGDTRLVHDPLRACTVALNAPGRTAPLGTFEWDGRTWTPRQSAHVPALGALAATFDRARGVVLVLGRNDARQGMDTWTWNGIDWQLQTQNGPPVPSAFELAFDSQRGRAVAMLAVGSSSSPLQTWEWNGVQWTQPALATTPLQRSFYAFGYDEGARRMLLAGGSGTKGLMRDAWDYDGVAWRRLVAAPTPMTFVGCTYAAHRGALQARAANGDLWEWQGTDWARVALRELVPTSAMAPEPHRGGVLRFGGLIQLGPSVTFFGDTWQHFGAGWTRCQPVHAPSARAGHVLWSDGADAWLWGGVLPNTRQSNETWRFDGTDWTQLAPAQAPPGRADAGVAFDAARRRAVLFGGVNQVATLGDTWEFDGVNWLQAQPATSPPPRSKPALAFDAPRARVVLCHGLDPNGSPIPDGWQWDGAQWTAIAPVTATSPFGRVTMAFDAQRGRVVLYTEEIGQLGVWTFDGLAWTRLPGPTGFAPFGELAASATARGSVLLDTGITWRHGPSLARVEALGAACAGAAGLWAGTVPAFDAGDFGFELTGLGAGGPALLLLGTASANVAIGSCTLSVAQPLAMFVVADALGCARLSAAVPADPSLRGQSLFAQAANLAPAGFALSAAMRLVFGD
jgi:hypothetical protein